MLVLLAAALASGVLLSIPTDSDGLPEPGATLPSGSQSEEAAIRAADRTEAQVAPLLVVFSREGETLLSSADSDAITAQIPAVQRAVDDAAGGPETSPPMVLEPGPDGNVLVASLLVRTDLPIEQLTATVSDVRRAASEGLDAPLQAQVTGSPAFEADLASVFDGADLKLLAATASVVAVLLLLTYRSPVLWLVPLIVVGTGDQVAASTISLVSPLVGIEVDPASAGIVSVLVFGAGTNYALLLVSRYRDELRIHHERSVAMAVALRATAPAVLASGFTVVLSLLVLLLALLPSTRALGLAGAVGVVIAMLVGLVVLPAALVLPGRWLFWPFVPRVGDTLTVDRSGLWSRVGAAVSARPLAMGCSAFVLLVLAGLGVSGLTVGLSPEQAFRERPDAVAGQETLERSLTPGAVQPVQVYSSPGTAEAVAEAATGAVGVASATAGPDGQSTMVILQDAPGSNASDRSLIGLRERLAEDPSLGAVVGGSTAEQYDTTQAYERDARIVIPLVLIVVTIVLIALLRALVAPLLLITSVVISNVAAFGIGWSLLRWVDGRPLDSSVPLLAFLFLVALGVDYNIFLIARTREDVLLGRSTQRAVVRALASTGGVITSAGIVLAAVFAVLGVLPLIALAQIGTIVGLGVLIDTLLVRTVLVPSLAVLTKQRFWWPGNPETITDPPSHQRNQSTELLEAGISP